MPKETARPTSVPEARRIELETLNRELQKSRQDLAAARDKYADLFESAPIGYLLLDAHDQITDVNLTFCQMVGVYRSELIKQKLSGFISPEDRGAFSLYSYQVRRERTNKTIKLRLQKADGMYFWARFTANSTRENELRITVIDVTEQKKAEDDLRESQQKHQALIETVCDFVWEIDAQGRYTYCSPQMKKLWGYDPAERTGKSFFDAMLPHDKELGKDIFTGLARAQRPFAGIEFDSLDSQGRVITIEVSGVPYFGPDGAFAGFRGISRDITERKKAEMTINLAKDIAEFEKNRLKTLLEVCPSAVIIVDQPEGKISFINEQARQLYGMDPRGLKMKEHVKIGLLKMDGKPYLAEEMPVNRSLLHGEIVRHEEMVLARPDGSRTVIISSSVPLRDANGKIVAVIGVFDDITERKTMEQALKTFSLRLIEVQEEERKRIAYELHDDTAQYLALLKMQLNALLESGKIQNTEVLEKLRYLEKDSDRAFNDVRRYSHELRPVILERAGLTAALNQIVDDFNKIGELPARMKITGSEPELSENVKLGFFRIAQEALGNARKHSKASQASISLTFQETRLEMQVNDNGTGFNLAEASVRASKKGSLGIMSMQERAKAIGAKLKIESKTGKGTTIRVEIELKGERESRKL